MKNEWTAWIPVEPVPKARPRLGCGGNVYTPNRTKQCEFFIKMFARKTWKISPLSCPVELEFIFHCKPVKKSSNGYPRGDVDNYLKLADALNGCIFDDDDQVIKITGSIQYAESLDKMGFWLKVRW